MWQKHQQMVNDMYNTKHQGKRTRAVANRIRLGTTWKIGNIDRISNTVTRYRCSAVEIDRQNESNALPSQALSNKHTTAADAAAADDDDPKEALVCDMQTTGEIHSAKKNEKALDRWETRRALLVVWNGWGEYTNECQRRHVARWKL